MPRSPLSPGPRTPVRTPDASPRRSPRLLEPRLTTPPSAQYAQRRPAPRAATETANDGGELQPLPPKAGVEALVERFKLVMGADLLPSTDPKRNFCVETLRTGLKERLRDNGLLRESEHPFGAGHRLPVTVVERPAFDRCIFFVEPPAPSDAADAPALRDLRYFSVPNSSMAHLMAQMGYEVISVTHLPPNPSRLPPPLVQERTRGPQSTGRTPAPLQLRVPKKVPPFNKDATAPTVASQLVEHFELRVVIRENGKDEV